jgi:N6-L-threonylcarbamoyladenine synthase
LKVKADQHLYMGIDTSAYTTSLALVNQHEILIYDGRMSLPVGPGQLGLRQSDAVFAHIRNISQMMEAEPFCHDRSALCAVVSSAMPRPVQGSYMPVFKVGEAFGLFLAKTAGLLYFNSTHQEGHILAGLWSAGLSRGRYLVIHLSGGTTEILSVSETGPGYLEIEKLGGSSDLNAGQFIDRLGQAMGLNFPAGPGLEKLACQAGAEIPCLPVSVNNGEISFSGPASHAERLLEKGCPSENLARAVEICIADSLSVAVKSLMSKPHDHTALLVVGGVAANQTIRIRMKEKLGEWKIFYAEPAYAADNAVGLAVQAKRLASPVT